MKKAKSRLKNKKQVIKLPWASYLEHLPTLVIGLLFYVGLYFLVTKFYPAQIQNFIVPNTYLPLQIFLFGGNFFLLSYIFLSARRGLLLSLAVAWMLFLKLQLVENWLMVGLVGLGALVGVEILVLASKKWLR